MKFADVCRAVSYHNPPQTAEMIHLLESFIEEEKNGDDMISKAGEDGVERITEG